MSASSRLTVTALQLPPCTSDLASNEAVAFELIAAGTSFTPCKSAVRLMTSSSPATVEMLKARTSSTNNRLFFIMFILPLVRTHAEFSKGRG